MKPFEISMSGPSLRAPSPLSVALLGIAVLLVGLGGCSTRSRKGASADVMAQLNGQQIIPTLGVTKFALLTSGDMVKSGLVAAVGGGIAGQVMKDSLVEARGLDATIDGGLVDPARDIAAGLSLRFKAESGVTLSGQPVQLESEKIATILATAPTSSRFVLDLRTKTWGAAYVRSQWDRYRTYYSIRARLIDRTTQAAVAEAECRPRSKVQVALASYDELVADKAARIRSDMADYASQCVEVLWTQMFASASKQAPRPSTTSAVSEQGTTSPSPRTTDFVMSTPDTAARYQSYRTRPNPKAFAISDNGGSWMAWGESTNPMVKETIAQRALRGCQERTQAKCVLYAVDDKVVYSPSADAKP